MHQIRAFCMQNSQTFFCGRTIDPPYSLRHDWRILAICMQTNTIKPRPVWQQREQSTSNRRTAILDKRYSCSSFAVRRHLMTGSWDRQHQLICHRIATPTRKSERWPIQTQWSLFIFARHWLNVLCSSFRQKMIIGSLIISSSFQLTRANWASKWRT